MNNQSQSKQPAVRIVQTARKKDHLDMKVNQTSKRGFTLIEIMIVVAIIGLLAAIAIPNFVHARSTSQKNACINNLRQIDGAKQQWALETKANPSASPLSSDIQPYMGRGSGGSLPICPLDSANGFDSSYLVQALTTAPTCQIDSTNHVLN